MNTAPVTDDHLIQLPDENWSLWRWTCLRTAGFPFADVLPLAGSPQQASAYIRRMASANSFREAIAWQNRQTLSGAVDALLRTPLDCRNSETRKREQLVAKYVYRFAAKNETIGFFGPVTWARLDPESAGVSVVHGPNLVKSRESHFEVWAMDALGDALGRDVEIRQSLAPRLRPDIRIDGTMLHTPWCPPSVVPPHMAVVLGACDGNTAACDIAARFSGLLDVYAVLEQLVEEDLITWKLEAPICVHPERHIRDALNRIGDSEVRTRALGPLDDLEACREGVSKAAGDARQLTEALEGLETVFTRYTGVPPTRSPGRTHAARTVVVEDCSRDVAVTVGAEVIASLAPPLTLLLIGARWFAKRIAERATTILHSIFEQLAAETRSRVVDFPRLWQRAEGVVFGDGQPVDIVLPEYQRLWKTLLVDPRGTDPIQYQVAALRQKVETTFAVSGVGRLPIHHSPDVLVAAADAQALCEGRYTLVLGELHAATNTLRNGVFVSQHPCPEELQRCFATDYRGRSAATVVPKAYWPVKSGRLAPALASAGSVGIALGPEPVECGGAAIVPASMWVVQERSGVLVLRTRDRRMTVDLLDAFADTPLLSTRGFRLLANAPHRPRISFDALVVSRETWSFLPSEIAFVAGATAASRFAEATRWGLQNRMPRFVFVRIPREPKPLVIDFQSTLAIEIVAKALRCLPDAARATAVVFTEMLPQPDQLWLSDPAGRRYTSELRMVAVDHVAQASRARWNRRVIRSR